jgi:hypothetical protein
MAAGAYTVEIIILFCVIGVIVALAGVLCNLTAVRRSHLVNVAIFDKPRLSANCTCKCHNLN